MLIGQDTHARLNDWVCREVDRVRVKGKHEPVSIFEPLGPRRAVAPSVLAEVEQWDEMLERMRAQQWGAARERLLQLKTASTANELIDLYLRRLDALEAHPPGPQWDGVTTFETK